MDRYTWQWQFSGILDYNSSILNIGASLPSVWLRPCWHSDPVQSEPERKDQRWPNYKTNMEVRDSEGPLHQRSSLVDRALIRMNYTGGRASRRLTIKHSHSAAAKRMGFGHFSLAVQSMSRKKPCSQFTFNCKYPRRPGVVPGAWWRRGLLGQQDLDCRVLSGICTVSSSVVEMWRYI